jgi:cytochrome c-type biogenesis protein CcmH/NrfG
MLARENSVYERQDTLATGRKLRMLQRPSTLWGWFLWLLIALLFVLLVSYVLVPWWYGPVPTDIPPATPNSNTMKT